MRSLDARRSLERSAAISPDTDPKMSPMASIDQHRRCRAWILHHRVAVPSRHCSAALRAFPDKRWWRQVIQTRRAGGPPSASPGVEALADHQRRGCQEWRGVSPALDASHDPGPLRRRPAPSGLDIARRASMHHPWFMRPTQPCRPEIARRRSTVDARGRPQPDGPTPPAGDAAPHREPVGFGRR